VSTLTQSAPTGRRARELAPSHPRHANLDLVEVATWSRARAEQAMEEGGTPPAEALAPWLWRGYNLPAFTGLLGFRKFYKGFELDAERGLVGFNLRVRSQGGPLDPWVGLRNRQGQPKRHGFYDVGLPSGADNAYPHALLIDYDCGRNPALDPSSLLRDYLVALGPDLLLGKAYAALGRRRVPVSYFVLERARYLDPS